MSQSAAETLPEYPSEALIEHPYDYFEQARRVAPVVQSRRANEILVFRHADVAHVLKHPELYSEEIPNPWVHRFDRGVETLISNISPPRHKEVRDYASGPIKPGRLKQATDDMRAIVDMLIDRFESRGKVELMTEFGLPLPAHVICRLLGLPEEGEGFEFLTSYWARAVGHGDFTVESGDGADSLEMRVSDYFEGEIKRRLAAPTDDALTSLIRTQIDRDGTLNLDHVTVIATELFTSGAGTTALMVVNAMWLLLENPSELEKVLADRSLIPRMIEEALRLESVVQERERIAMVDTELAGVPVPAGTMVRLVLAAANRDPEVFPDPDKFIVDRPYREVKAHLGFGTGIHSCLGAPLARLEGIVALERLFERLTNFRLSDENDYKHMHSTRFRALKALHLQFDRR